jgi:threonine synthase
MVQTNKAMITNTCLMFPAPKEANSQFVSHENKLCILVSSSGNYDQSVAQVREVGGVGTYFVSKWDLFYVIPDNMQKKEEVKEKDRDAFHDYPKMTWRYKSQFLLKIRQELSGVKYHELLDMIYESLDEGHGKLQVLVIFKNLTNMELKQAKDFVEDYYLSKTK